MFPFQIQCIIIHKYFWKKTKKKTNHLSKSTENARKNLKPIVETETSVGNMYESEADGKGKIIIG